MQCVELKVLLWYRQNKKMNNHGVKLRRLRTQVIRPTLCPLDAISGLLPDFNADGHACKHAKT